jgi:hypothetical protein
VHHAGAAGLGERAGCSWRVAAHRVGSEDGCADQGPPARLLTAGSAACPRPAAPARTSVPVTAKFAAWTWPRGPSASELTGWRDGRVPVPGSALGEECRDEERPGSQAAVQQTPSPSRRPAMRAGVFHEQTVANWGGEDGTPPDGQGRHTRRRSHQRGSPALTVASAAAGGPA